MIQRIRTETEGRVETGAVQFNDDWPGLYIRGDHVILWLKPLLQRALEDAPPLVRSLTERMLRLADEVKS